MAKEKDETPAPSPVYNDRKMANKDDYAAFIIAAVFVLAIFLFCKYFK